MAMAIVREQPVELQNLAWSKPKLKHRAPNLLALIEHFNNFSMKVRGRQSRCMRVCACNHWAERTDQQARAFVSSVLL